MLYIMADVFAPLMVSIISQFFLPIQNPRIALSDALLSIGTSPGFDDGLKTLKDGIEQLDGGAKKLDSGVNAYTKGVQELNDGIQKYLGSKGVQEQHWTVRSQRHRRPEIPSWLLPCRVQKQICRPFPRSARAFPQTPHRSQLLIRSRLRRSTWRCRRWMWMP